MIAKNKICSSLDHHGVSAKEMSTIPAANGADVPDWMTPRATPVAMIPNFCRMFCVSGASTLSSLASAGCRNPMTVMTRPTTPSATIAHRL